MSCYTISDAYNSTTTTSTAPEIMNQPGSVNYSPELSNSDDLRQQHQRLLSNVSRASSKSDDEDSSLEKIEFSKEISKRNGSAIRINIPSDERRNQRNEFPEERIKTLVAFVWLAFNFMFATVSLALTHERVPDPRVVSALPDIILDSVSPRDWALTVSEILLSASTFVAFFTMAIHKHRFIVFRRVFFILGWLYLMRSCTMYVTVLPVASRSYALNVCAPKANTTSPFVIARRAIQLMSGFGLSMNGQHVYCGDYMYSGHTVVLVSAYLIITEYSSNSKRWHVTILHWGSWLVSLVGVIMILVSRGHYTVDVLVAYYVTTRLWWTYHTMANNPTLKLKNSPSNYLSREWWFPVFLYLEGNVLAAVPRQYNYPSACLSKLVRRLLRRKNNRI